MRCFVSSSIPNEVDKTGLLTFLQLEEGAEYWADKIYHNRDYQRRSYLEQIKLAGYDAETSAKDLQNLYLSKL